jgi:rSAM/selenodomain-associated transferase 1
MNRTIPDGTVLGVLAKKPIAGQVKTRIAALYGPSVAAELHEAMLLDLLETWDSAAALSPGVRRVLVYAPADAGPWFQARVSASFALQPQAEGSLGRRMQEFFAGEFDRGASRVVLIGSDAPTLDPAVIVNAFRCLENRDVVLGPATDGGYYLVGSRLQAPPIFEGVDWSTPSVLDQTIERLSTSGRSLAVLPPWYDIDTPQDLRMLWGHLRALRYAGVDPRLPRTEALLGTLMA